MSEEFKVFIAWSGSRSRRVASLIKPLLEDVIGNNCRPWMSDQDIDKGTNWMGQLTEALRSSKAAIVVLTKDYKDSQWILFESGAAWKAAEANRCCALLCDLSHTDLIHGPFTHLQPTKLECDDFLKLIKNINSDCGDNAHETKMIRRFEKEWPAFNTEAQKIINEKSEPKKVSEPKSAQVEYFEEILRSLREMARTIQSELPH